ncbi:uncharacterized protein LOC100898413 [Galendromus occidentalis]|uniref:Uncharacterized protein LOC100898413 n=1 Tax=Galendromus occidentalis TaxID=34638 RepID=A0AAJ6QTB9_9ACAR|nr:uncharacterized protein LOC100898413 [Galendromus occidentalis]
MRSDVKCSISTIVDVRGSAAYHVSGVLGQQNGFRKHIVSKSHRRKVTGKEASLVKERKLQVVVPEMFDKQSSQKQQRKVELLSLVKEFRSANIPLYKLEQASLKLYLERNLKNIGAIPCSRHLRQKYLPSVFETHVKEPKGILKNSSSLAIVCDETIDAEDREAVINELNEDDVSFSKVSALVTDNTAYMHKAWSHSLRAVLLNAVYVTCTAHLLNLICELWQEVFKSVNKLGLPVKIGFTACLSRKARFAHYLKAKGGSVALPPVLPPPYGSFQEIREQ